MNSRCDLLREALARVEAGADGGTARSQLVQMGEGGLDATDAVLDLEERNQSIIGYSNHCYNLQDLLLINYCTTSMRLSTDGLQT